MNKTTATLFLRRLGLNLSAAIVLIGTIYCMHTMSMQNFTRPSLDAGKPAATGGLQWFLDKHEGDCWTTGPAKAKFPGHVIASVGAGELHYMGKAAAGKALDQVFNHKNHHMSIGAFCR